MGYLIKPIHMSEETKEKLRRQAIDAGLKAMKKRKEAKVSWEKGRPEGWKNPLSIENATNETIYPDKFSEAYEDGADAMHKADLEFLRQFPDVIQRMQASMTKQQWFDFIGKKT